jgi:hypothetical protein
MAERRPLFVDFGDWPEFQPPSAPCAECILKGRIGGLNPSKGCYTFWEVFQIAAEDIAMTGRGSFARAQLARGRTACDVIRDLYGVALPDPKPFGYRHRPQLETRTVRAGDSRG